MTLQQIVYLLSESDLTVGFPGDAVVKNPSTYSGDVGQSLGPEDPLE